MKKEVSPAMAIGILAAVVILAIVIFGLRGNMASRGNAQDQARGQQAGEEMMQMMQNHQRPASKTSRPGGPATSSPSGQ